MRNLEIKIKIKASDYFYGYVWEKVKEHYTENLFEKDKSGTKTTVEFMEGGEYESPEMMEEK